jgi:peptidoglycan/xylan/chitin deacetylase (PgdA/CDA1 family)
LWTLRFPIKATRVVLYLEPGSVRPVALAIASRRLRARTEIRFGHLSTALLREFERQLQPKRTKLRAETAFARLLQLDRPVYCGGNRRRVVALTFDDGPGPYTPLALRILRRAGARATFFLVGRNLRGKGSIVRAERAVGALGDHSWTHPFLPRLGGAAIRSQLRLTQAAITEVARGPVELFRPPYGATNRLIDADAHHDGMLVILWSVDTRDSEGARWTQIASTVEQDARAGSIILMHENHGQTIRALKFRILPWLRRRGLRPVTIPYLLSRDTPTVAQLDAGQRGCTTTRMRPASG